MEFRARTFGLIMIMVSVAITAAGIWVWGLYRTSLDDNAAGLLRLVQSQARLIEAVAHFDQEHSQGDHPEGAWGATLSQLEAAQKEYSQFGETGEFVFARRENDKIIFLFPRRFDTPDDVGSVPFESDLAAPMRNALMGHSGTIIGPDYRNVSVLAAYENLKGLNIGIVAKIDMSELQAPFVAVALWGGGSTLFIIFVGVFFTLRISRPIVERLETSIAAFNKAQQIAHLGHWEWDIQAGGLKWSDEIYSIFGLKVHEFEATYEAFLQRVHPDDRANVESAVAAALKGEAYNIEHRILQPSGVERVVNEVGQVMFDKDGNPVRMTGLVQDITERKQAEEDLTATLIKLERANQAKSEFMATMSHEFRTPLNAILGFSEMLRSQYFGPLGSKNYGEYANDIFVSGEHLLDLINDMLDIAAIEAGKRTLHKEDVVVANILKYCRDTMMPAATEKSLSLLIHGSDPSLSLRAHKRSMEQVLLNLLSNAIKYTDQGGTIHLQAQAQNGNIELKVSDNGQGIAADKINSVTDPFVQSSSDPYHTQNGTGLGLSIVKSLVDAHKGSLVIESEVGVGTTVTVTLPAHDPTASET